MNGKTGIWNVFGFQNFLNTIIFPEMAMKIDKGNINFVIIKFINQVIINNYLDNVIISLRKGICNRLYLNPGFYPDVHNP